VAILSWPVRALTGLHAPRIFVTLVVRCWRMSPIRRLNQRARSIV